MMYECMHAHDRWPTKTTLRTEIFHAVCGRDWLLRLLWGVNERKMCIPTYLCGKVCVCVLLLHVRYSRGKWHSNLLFKWTLKTFKSILIVPSQYMTLIWKKFGQYTLFIRVWTPRTASIFYVLWFAPSSRSIHK